MTDHTRATGPIGKRMARRQTNVGLNRRRRVSALFR